MRRLVILLAAALAGCSVELEGAACDVPGETAQCPSGQACGVDRKCSSKPKYECDPAGAELAVDVAQSGKLGGSVTVTPTGAVEPPGCRLPTLDAALAAVVTGTTGIKIYGDGVSTFTRTAPLALRPGFTLTGEKPVPANVVLQATSAMATVVDLAPGATLRYVTIESSVDQAGDALTVACGSETAKATLTNVKVNGANKLRRGLTVTGKCGVEATDLVVTGAKQDGVYVDADASENVTTTITSGELAQNGGNGLAVRAGRVVLQGNGAGDFGLHHNADHGAFVTSSDTATLPSDLTLRLVAVHENEGAGVVVLDSKRAGNTSSVVLEGVKIYKNASTSYSGRQVGGLLLQGALAPTFSMRSSVLCSNAKDEVAVYSSANWDLSGGTACGSTSNRYFLPGVADYFIWSTASGTNVDGKFNYFFAGGDPPTSYLKGVDFGTECTPVPQTPAYCN